MSSNVAIKTEMPDEDQVLSNRVAETFSVKQEPVAIEEEAVDPLEEDEEESFLPDIDVSQFLLQNIVTPRSTEFDKRIFPRKGIRNCSREPKISRFGVDKIPVVGQAERINLDINFTREPKQQKTSQNAKRARKVELERERRFELTQLYDRLQYWTEVDDEELSSG